jgi:hypothetical protein
VEVEQSYRELPERQADLPPPSLVPRQKPPVTAIDEKRGEAV